MLLLSPLALSPVTTRSIFPATLFRPLRDLRLRFTAVSYRYFRPLPLLNGCNLRAASSIKGGARENSLPCALAHFTPPRRLLISIIYNSFIPTPPRFLTVQHRASRSVLTSCSLSYSSPRILHRATSDDVEANRCRLFALTTLPTLDVSRHFGGNFVAN
jgi:hypothetical protein